MLAMESSHPINLDDLPPEPSSAVKHIRCHSQPTGSDPAAFLDSHGTAAVEAHVSYATLCCQIWLTVGFAQQQLHIEHRLEQLIEAKRDAH
jgi:hypothetical protein